VRAQPRRADRSTARSAESARQFRKRYEDQTEPRQEQTSDHTVPIRKIEMSPGATLDADSNRISRPPLSRKRATPGIWNKNRPPAICQVTPRLVASSRPAGTDVARTVTAGALTCRAGMAPGQFDLAGDREPGDTIGMHSLLRPRTRPSCDSGGALILAFRNL